MRTMIRELVTHRAHDTIPLGRTTILVVIAGAALYLGYMLFEMGFTVVSDRYELTVELSDAGGLDEADRSPVAIAGVVSGRLEDIRYEDGKAVATLSMFKESRGHVHSNATIELVPRSGLQDVTINIDPGNAAKPELTDGDRIAASRTTSYAGIDRLTQVVDADTRAYAQILLQELERSLRGRNGELRAAVKELGPALDASAGVADILADRRALLADLVTEVDTVFATLGRRRQQLAESTRLGRQVQETLAGRDEELADTVRLLPSTLAQTRAALVEVEELAAPLNPALDRLSAPARTLPGGVRALREFIPTGSRLVDDLKPLLRTARPRLADLDRALTELRPASIAMQPGTRKLLPTLTPLAEDVGPNGGAHEGIANVSGVVSTNDRLGAVGRGGVAAVEDPVPENYGFPEDLGPEQRKRMNGQLNEALNLTCLLVNRQACWPRTAIPGLPGYMPPRERSRSGR